MSEFVDVTLTSENREGTQSILGRWFKKVGEAVQQHEPLVEISTDKVSMEIPAPATGVLTEILKNDNDEIKPGEVLGRIALGAVAVAAPEGVAKAPAGALAGAKSISSAQAPGLSPAVKKLLKDHQVDASQVVGSGAGGRITSDDVMAFVAKRDSGGAQVSPGLGGRRVAHTPVRKSIAAHMVQSLLHTAPHVTSVFQCDFSKIIADREKRKAEFEKKGVKLTLTTYIVAAVARALKAVPEVNSRWHDDALEIFEAMNIGIGTATPDGGLIVPVIKGAERLSFDELAAALSDLTARARSGALQTVDVRDGTFTISNHGMTGSLVATPIVINQPQSAILGVGKLEKRPIVVEQDGRDEIVIRPMVYVTLTIDHRVLDGFKANQFLTVFVDSLEHWEG